MAHFHTPSHCPRGGAAWSSRTAAGLLLLILMPALAAAQSDALSLDAAIRLALQNNERALAADQRVAAADSRLTKARAFFMPTITLNGNYTRRPFEVPLTIGNQQVIVQAYNALSWSANFSMILFDAHSVPTLLGAGDDLSAERLNTADAKRKLAFEVGNAFLTTLSVDQVLQASQRRLEFAKQSLDAAKARYAGGLVSVNDVTRAELEYATAETGVVQGQGQVETTYLQLGFLLNAPPPSKLAVPDLLLSAVEEKKAAQEDLIAQAQTRRPLALVSQVILGDDLQSFHVNDGDFILVFHVHIQFSLSVTLGLLHRAADINRAGHRAILGINHRDAGRDVA